MSLDDSYSLCGLYKKSIFTLYFHFRKECVLWMKKNISICVYFLTKCEADDKYTRTRYFGCSFQHLIQEFNILKLTFVMKKLFLASPDLQSSFRHLANLRSFHWVPNFICHFFPSAKNCEEI